MKKFNPCHKTMVDNWRDNLSDGVVEFDWLTVVHTITVNQNKWL